MINLMMRFHFDETIKCNAARSFEYERQRKIMSKKLRQLGISEYSIFRLILETEEQQKIKPIIMR